MSRTSRILVAEAIGTAILILAGPGSAMIATGVFGSSIGTLGVSLAFGLGLLCAAYLFGHISGCHINPAVTIGMWALGRTKGREVPAYIVGQVIGAVLASVALFGIFESGGQLGEGNLAGVSREALFSSASNGYGSHSPGGFALGSVMITEVIFTALFVLVIAGTTRASAIAGFAGIPIGLMLALVHLVTIPVDNTSVNPVRSFSTAIFANGWAFEQLWVFIVFPIIGALVGAGIWRVVTTADDENPATP
jgi:aquaporin Z